jgi:nicotinamidase-related amidase
MKALLIIDMQAGSFTDTTPRFDTEGVVSRINGLSTHFRKNGNPVIFIQHDGTKENNFLPGSNEWQLLPSLDIRAADIKVSKTANDCFYRSQLEQVLTGNAIGELIITGCATDFCVDTTIRAAMAKDYNITIIKDGHTTTDRPHADAETVIRHHNWLWENMIPTGGKIQVISFADWLETQ